MRINHNIAALNTYRQLNSASTAQGKSMEKLSSGLRINKAGDDAAGLAISEKMRGQIRGLEMGSKNAQDGISFIQTAEGALNETHSILQRMRELAVQSSNDTNTDADRSELQKEVDQLAEEITRIANNTEFNTKSLLNGAVDDNNVKAATFHIGANAGQNLELTIGAMDAKSLGVTRDVQSAKVSGATDVTGATLSGTLGTALTDGASLTLSADDTAAKTTWSAADLGITGTSLASTSNSSEYNDYTITVTKTGGAGADVTAAIDSTAKTITINYSSDVAAAGSTAAKLQSALDGANINLTATGDATAVAGGTDVAATTAGLADDEVKLTIGSEDVIVKDTATSATFTSAANQGLTVNLDGAVTGSAAATIDIGISSSSEATFAGGAKTADANVAGGIDISSQSAADTAITAINTAIETVSTERSKLGAYQNRLEHTINNLNTSSENLTAAESRVRDVDMAKEMMEQTKNSILSQAAQAMLAQSNQLPNGVLQLLR
ncbi:flagellin [Pseudalkalibacillus salsuginis]|uniref:flagellin N-terminal helical domain-containing protein n=1 Tax=Pseudalkalibacillus salsuginis TaxID=2910972 RepID=UPI001F2DA5DC|nr:flagellin [Pseudalkalibacillus salsuginis]MCF6410152.1 flagellin [Pseudalkalibacillus salsuginis]